MYTDGNITVESRKLMMEERNGGIAEPMSLCRREAMGFSAQEGLLLAGAGIIHLKAWWEGRLCGCRGWYSIDVV